MLQQFSEIACEELGGERGRTAIGSAVTAAVVSEKLGLLADEANHAIPDAAVEREGMDERQPGRAPTRRGVNCKRDRRSVGGPERVVASV
jgi:hypothetical protein